MQEICSVLDELDQSRLEFQLHATAEL